MREPIQLELFADPAPIQGFPPAPIAQGPAPGNLSDVELIVALPDSNLADTCALAVEAGNRRLTAAVTTLVSLCKRFAGFGIDRMVPEQAAALAAAAPGTSAQVLAWIASAEAATGVSGANWTAGLADIIAHESAGNPNAINNWDINAKEGHPSQGLMQTIPSTFARWAVPGLGGILNPVANIAAGINYIIDRYGSIGNVPGIRSQAAGGPYVGYRMGGILGLPVNLFDDGGMLPQGWSVAGNFTGRSEPVTPAGGPGFGVPFSPNITVIGGGDAQKTAAIVEGRVRHAWVDMMHGAGRY